MNEFIHIKEILKDYSKNKYENAVKKKKELIKNLGWIKGIEKFEKWRKENFKI